MAKARTPRTPKPKAEKAEKKVLQMPDTTVSAGSNGNSRRSSAELESEIRLRAYQLFVHRGYVHGLDEQDWLEAEREVLSRSAHKHSA
jgi:Protein of unknown function (DUF2934)